MQFIDLAAQQKRIRSAIEANITNVLNHGKYVMGPEISILEDRLADYVGVRYAIGCSSGTDALLLALMAYDIGPGDAIFTTPFTFVATAEVIRLVGATPVFAEIDPDTFNIDPAALEKAIDSVVNGQISGTSPPLKPRGIIAVDLFGLPADYEAVNAIARKYDLFVIEDAAQSFGAEYHSKKAGSFGDIACTSFFPAKPLGCYGDGGAVFTNQAELAEKIISMRVHGQGQGHESDQYDNVRIGINGRMDTLQAAVLLAKFDIFPEEVERRQQVARRYTEHLGSHPSIHTPIIPMGMKSVWAQYSVLAKNEAHRQALQDKLGAADIPTAVYYPRPLHLQTAFSYLGYKQGDFPISEDYSRRIFSLPMHPYLKENEQAKISEILIRE